MPDQAAKRRFRVYVDESGDRGNGRNASPVFVLAALVVDDAQDHQLRAARDELCRTLGKPPETVLHWAENIKDHGARVVAAQALRHLPARFIYVIVHKAGLEGNYVLGDHAAMYNYAVHRLLERVSWHVASKRGEAILTFAHVRRFPYERFLAYIDHLRAIRTRIEWDAIRGNPRINTPENIASLQWADMAAGCLTAAVRPNKYDNVEPRYLLDMAPRIYCPYDTDRVGIYGLNVVGDPEWLQGHYWWPDLLRSL